MFVFFSVGGLFPQRFGELISDIFWGNLYKGTFLPMPPGMPGNESSTFVPENYPSTPWNYVFPQGTVFAAFLQIEIPGTKNVHKSWDRDCLEVNII